MKQYLHFTAVISTFLIILSGYSQTYKVDEQRIYSWNGAPDWVQHTTEQYTYANGGNKETSVLGLNFPGLEKSYQHNKTYNANNDIILIVKQSWNNTLMQWEDDSQDVYKYYPGTSNIKDVTTYNFDLGYDTFKISYEYSGTDITKITLQDGSSGSLVNFEKYEYTYNTPGQPYQEFDSEWNTSTNMWDLIERATATYVNGLRTELLVESYNGSTYDLYERYLSTYSGSLETEYLQQSWNGSNYVNSDRELSTYDGNGNKTAYIFESWNVGAWVPYYKEEKSFSLAGSLGTKSFENRAVKVYPNPVSDVLNISSVGTINRIEMFSILGENVLQQMSNTKQINVKGLRSGVYVLKVFNNDRSTTKRVVIK